MTGAKAAACAVAFLGSVALLAPVQAGILTSEPRKGALRLGQRVRVDGGSRPAGSRR